MLVRVYGHPELLQVAASINGDDFVPFNEALFKKQGSVHQSPGIRMAQHTGITLTGTRAYTASTSWGNCTAVAANGVWVVPGSHAEGKVDIAARVAEVGSERLPDAVPLICAPGDVVINNRQLLHGSFANTSQDWRVTVNSGSIDAHPFWAYRAVDCITKQPSMMRSVFAGARA